jgi:hypothetical protein
MSYRPGQLPNAQHVEAPQADNPLRPGDPLGSFVGYLRRPKASAAGLLAQIFGENGNDADVIAALHLTRFLDQPTKVTVWMLKDRNGRSMKKDGQWPKLAEFVGLIRRPSPSQNGQVAMFFGENGPNADALAVLNQTWCLDALVFVEMHQAQPGMTVGDLPTQTPGSELEENSGRMTTSEAAAYKVLSKRSEEALTLLLQHGFFRQNSVLAALGRQEAFQQWLTSQPCCFPGSAPCDRSPVLAWQPAGARKWQALPVCAHHAEQLDNGTATLPDGSPAAGWIASQTIASSQRWAQYALGQALKVPAGRLPTPGAIYAWTVERGLVGSVPTAFQRYLG